jgi:hypothetical protein
MRSRPKIAGNRVDASRASNTARARRGMRGTSLIEVVIAMTVASVMLATGMAAIHLLLRAERGASKNVWSGMTLTRLSRDLRSDVHAAKNVAIIPPDASHGQRLEMASAEGGTVTYEIAPGSVSRIVESADKVRERERFRFPETVEMTLQQLLNPDRVRLELVLPRSATAAAVKTTNQAAPSSSRTIHIEAVMFRDHRFISAGGDSR